MFNRFLLCSGLAAAVNLAVGYVLYGPLGLDDGLWFLGAVAVAFLSGMGVSYVLNRRFTYPPSGRAMRSELQGFLIVSLGGLSLTSGLAFFFDTYMNPAMEMLAPSGVLPETVSHVIAVGVTAIYSFLAHKHVSFRQLQAPDLSALGDTE